MHMHVGFVRDSLRDGGPPLLCSACDICLARGSTLSWEAAPGTVPHAGGVLKNRALAFIVLYFFFFFHIKAV